MSMGGSNIYKRRITLNADIKRRWVESLRSGNYRQGREALVVPNRILGDAFCCLGVLCDIAAKDGVVVRQAKSYLDPEDHLDQSYKALPLAVLQWSGLPISGRAANEVIIGDDIFLTTLNDNYEYDFDQIADVIEEKL